MRDSRHWRVWVTLMGLLLGGSLCGCLGKTEDDEKTQLEQENFPDPKVRLSGPLFSDRLDKRIIHNIVLEHKDELMACYAKALKKDQKLAGSLTIEWKITSDGMTKDVEIYESKFHGNPIEDCVMNSIKEWKFISPEDGEDASVMYLFTFLVE